MPTPGRPPADLPSAENAARPQSGVGIQQVTGDVNIGGDVVGRDKIIHSIQVIHQRALTAAEIAEQVRDLEAKLLAQGVRTYAQSLQARVAEGYDAQHAGPYRGLLEYRLGDSEVFYGRQQAIQALIRHLSLSPLVVLQSESGVGKTSLLQAGLTPHLMARGHLPILVRPYDVNPAVAIKRVFLADLGETPNLSAGSLRGFLKKVSDIVGPTATLYICLDQFEEFFAELTGAEQSVFVGELAECLDDAGLHVRWLISIRQEAFGELATFRPRVRNPYGNYYRLNRLTRQEAEAVIVEPARARGLAIEAPLVSRLLDELSKPDIAPVEVQLVCQALVQRLEPGQSALTLVDYEHQGGAAPILADYLNFVLARDVPNHLQAAARLLIESLVTSERRRTRRTLADLAHQLVTARIDAPALQDLLRRLVDSRVVRVEEGEAGAVYELSHDYLLGQITLDEAARQRKQADELLAAGVRRWPGMGLLLGSEELEIIQRQQANLLLDDDRLELLAWSAVRHRRNPAEWLNCLSAGRRLKVIEEARSALSLPLDRRRPHALALLWALRPYLPSATRAEMYRRHVAPRVLAVAIGLLATIGLVWGLYFWMTSPSAEMTGWRILSVPGLPKSRSLIVAVEPLMGRLVLVADQLNPGLFKSSDGGNSWAALDAPGDEGLQGLAIVGQAAYATTGRRVWRSSDAGEHWTALYTATDELGGVAVNPDDPDQILVISTAQGLLHSRNGGQEWLPLAAPEFAGEKIIGVTVNDAFLIVATRTDIWISEDGGSAWLRYEGQMPAHLLALAVYGTTGQFYIADGDQGLWNADTSGGDLLLPPVVEVPLVYASSVSVYGQTPYLDRLALQGLYAGTDQGLLCWREFDRQQPEWWLITLGLEVPCSRGQVVVVANP